MINIFQLADNDQAVFFLGQIFGNVGVALSGTGSAILSVIFKVFNTSLLSLGAVLVTYVTVVGVMATAQEGEFMGKKWNSLWVPLRTIGGIAALMPSGSGYCMAQVIIMWLIVQGIGAADQVWKAAIDYIGNGGAIQTIAPDASNDIGKIAPTAVSDIFSSLVCQSAAYKFMQNDANAMAHSSYTDGQYSFGVNGNSMCGSISWTSSKLDEHAKVAGQAMQLLVPQLEVLADHYVRSIIADPNCWTVTDTNTGQACSQQLPPSPANTCTYFQKYQSENFSNSSCKINNVGAAWSDLLGYAGSNFMTDSSRLIYGYAANATMNAASAAASNDEKETTGSLAGTTISNLGGNKNLQRAEANGWIYAGAYYYQIANMNNGISEYFQKVLDVFTNHTNPGYLVGQQIIQANANSYATMSKNPAKGHYEPHVMAVYCGADKNECPTSNMGGALGLAQEAKTAMQNAQNIGGGGIGIQASGGPLAGGGLAIINGWMGVLAPTGSQNPIVTIQHFGKGCLIAAEVLFWVGFALYLVLGGLSTMVVVLGNTVNYASGFAQSMMEYLLPAIFALITTLITIGAMLGVYVPLIPYVFFTFGAIGWMIASVEAMVAAPLIALGMLSPAGQHEILGRAEPAVMILLNIFLRPTLMVIGMIAGMLLSYVVIELINAAFLGVVSSITGSVGLIEGFLFIMAYAGLVITALNKAFSLIHILPDRVLRFIGGQPESYGEAEAAEQVKGKVSAGGQAAGQATGAAAAAGKALKAGRAAGLQAKEDAANKAAAKLGSQNTPAQPAAPPAAPKGGDNDPNAGG